MIDKLKEKYFKAKAYANDPVNSKKIKLGILIFFVSVVPIILIITLFQNNAGGRSVASVVTPPTPTSTASATLTPTPTSKPISGIYGIVFLDTNKNKKQGKNEKGIEGVVLALFQKGKSKASYSTISDKNGNYIFKTVAKGSYIVKLTVPPMYRITTNSSLSIVYAGVAAEANFGLLKVPTVYGKAFLDTNANNKYDVWELGVKGVKLTLKRGKQTLRRVSDAGGNYAFTGITGGKYTLSVTPPKGYKAVSNKYTVTFKKTDLQLNIPLKK